MKNPIQVIKTKAFVRTSPRRSPLRAGSLSTALALANPKNFGSCGNLFLARLVNVTIKESKSYDKA